MKWGDIPPLSTKTIRLQEGDLFVLTVNKYGLQVDDANLYCTIVLRPTAIALATMRARMEAVCHLYNWCGQAGIDLKARIESGEFFVREEVVALREGLRLDLRNPSAPRRRQLRSGRKRVGFKNRSSETRIGAIVAWPCGITSAGSLKR